MYDDIMIQFIISILYGIILGFCLLLKIFFLCENSNKKGNRLKFKFEFLSDIFLYLFFGVLYTVFACATLGGVLRWYSILTSIIICRLTYKMFNIPVKALKRMIFSINKRIISFVKKSVAIPILTFSIWSFQTFVSPFLKACIFLKIMHLNKKIIRKHKADINSKQIYFSTLLLAENK